MVYLLSSTNFTWPILEFFIVKFEHVSHQCLVFLMLIVSMYLLTRLLSAPKMVIITVEQIYSIINIKAFCKKRKGKRGMRMKNGNKE